MNSNNSQFGRDLLERHSKFIIVQVLVMIFLSINLLLLVTFFKNEFFYTTARYILFAVMLLSDSFSFFLNDIVILFIAFQITMQVLLCIILTILSVLYFTVTPVTLTAMTLERYVAICMPLRHAELCSIRRTVRVIFIIHGLSSLPCAVVLGIFFATASRDIYHQHRMCIIETLFLSKSWDHIRLAVLQFYFLIMCIIIMFCYLKIMKVVKTVSGEDKISSRKGLRTVTHAFQLLLCLIQFWYPLIESTILHIDFIAFVHVQFFNYIVFNLAPRCFSPLIYGLRDEMFLKALKKKPPLWLVCQKEVKER